MHISSRAPLLSAAASVVCIWIMSPSPPALPRSCFSAREDLHDAPVLGLRQRTAFRDSDDVAFLALAGLVVRMDLGRAAHDLAVQRVLHLALEQHRHGLLHLVADDATFDGALRFLVIAHGHCPLSFAPSRCLTCAISRRTRPNWWVCDSWPEPFCMRRLNCSRRSSSRCSLSCCALFWRSSLSSITAPSGPRIESEPTAWQRPGGTPRAPRPRRRLRSRTACGPAGQGPPSTRRCPCRCPCAPRSASSRSACPGTRGSTACRLASRNA